MERINYKVNSFFVVVFSTVGLLSCVGILLGAWHQIAMAGISFMVVCALRCENARIRERIG
jgi:hypothetical protein